MINTDGKFYLGQVVDAQSGKSSEQPLFYDPDDLTTHAVVVGMTGSGKTGLCIDMLEEAALQGIPALMIDPKGDITNALLHFPNLAPEDFKPWVNADLARREGKTVEQVAAETAELWRKGLAAQDMGSERLQALKDSADFAIYTPGSDAGIPVSILSSFKAPEIPWESNRELLREKISGTVTALLGLVGFQDVDPVRSREHILLANIFEHAWGQGKDLDLGELILQTQTPPFSKLGVFDVNMFFPEKDRFMLAMSLNSILAAPAFQVWIEGQPLDIPSLLFSPDGKPRHSIFYIAHLSDAERMFFVTLLFSAVESWMRTQSGATSLRSIVYFDEIFGYLPPVANPPSKQPMLRMLKQARAFGVGLVLVTQNPVDVDYKALSNAGTWFIGKLQTDQDKQRLLDGLEGVAGVGMNRAEYDRTISSLGKRVFLLHNVHESKPQLFMTRWAMNYLAGPLTRTHIPQLNAMAGAVAPVGPAAAGTEKGPAQTTFAASEVAQPAPGAQPASGAERGTSTRPAIPGQVKEYFLPNNLTFTQAFKAAGKTYLEEAQSMGIIYRPAMLAQASIRFLNRKYNLDVEVRRTALAVEPDRRGMVRWEEFQAEPVDARGLDTQPDPRARFGALEAPFTEAKLMLGMESDFQDWVYRTTQVTVRAHEALKIYAGPDVSSGEFREMLAEAARKERDGEAGKIVDKYDKKIASVQTKLDREERELSEDETELSQRKMEELGTHAENIFSLFSGRRRRVTSSLTKRRLTEKAKADVKESVEAIQAYKREIADLEKEKGQALEEVNERWAEIIDQVTEINVTPYKKDVLIELFGVAWVPYHIVRIGQEDIELPGYGHQT